VRDFHPLEKRSSTIELRRFAAYLARLHGAPSAQGSKAARVTGVVKARPMALEGLDGKVAWITGGGKGIGRAIALALSARGVRVVVSGRDEKALGRVVGEMVHGGGKARHIVGDVRDPASARAAVARAIETFGALDFAIANAGQSARAELGGELARSESIHQTNQLGGLYTFDAAAPAMKGPGRLIAMSHAPATCGAAGYAAYAASKAGIDGLVRATARELAPRKITCNAIAPAWVDTDMADARLAEIARDTSRERGDVKKDAASATPLGRFVEPEEIAELVVFLCSKGADAITGQALPI
jgi:NAD(P)-dependent dehydrogenase (short-subunit alcohol dehydrogenase family)